MRKLIEPSSLQIKNIVDNAPFTGYLEDESGYVSSASLYDYDELLEHETAEFGSNESNLQIFIKSKTCVNDVQSKTKRKLEKNSLKERKSRKRVDTERLGEQKLKRKSLKFRKSVHALEEPTNEPNGKHVSRRNILKKDVGFSKKPRTDVKDQEHRNHCSPNSDDSYTNPHVKVGSSLDVNKKCQKPLGNKNYDCDLDRKTATNVTGNPVRISKRKKLCKASEKVSKALRECNNKRNSVASHATQGTIAIQDKLFEVQSSQSEAPRLSSCRSYQEGVNKKGMKVPAEAILVKDAGSKLQLVSNKEQFHANVNGTLKNGQLKDFCTSLETVHSFVEHTRHTIGRDAENGATGEEVSSGITEGGEKNKEHTTNPTAIGKSTDTSSTEFGWVLCDNCQKWRCIPSSLADLIETTNCGWSCKDNPNKKFADCSVPQEKSNAEINAELEISDVSMCDEGDFKDVPVDSKLSNDIHTQNKFDDHHQQVSWTLIRHNIFQHRSRKTQTIDEQMVCGCLPPKDGGFGCGEDCLNRMLNIECIPQTCPCGDMCSNQQFQRRLYTKVRYFRCGKKGFGLQVLEDVSMGTFIIEYVGEVLDMTSYEARHKEYALAGQKHFYFMTLNNSEVIDACVKGNLGRFINHSCEPNCRTEKWMVNGEVCIGIFAIRDIKKGEEITFDYNFVRLRGAAAKKCLCGARQCRGYIGGDPMTSPSLVESDSEGDDPEPVMLEESSEDESGVNNRHAEGSSVKEVFNAGAIKARSASQDIDSKSMKGVSAEISEGNLEAVEEALNELLDENGGLCKGQLHAEEVSARYLKLLLRIATDNKSSGEATRRIRDVSMLLDALLKTQSRAMLGAVIKTNGLQVLHKAIHHSKDDYKKTPIIRKLLKVLEFLAIKRVLTVEQINSEPACPSMESLRETIFQLCRHADTEVQQIARRFKENWLIKYSARNLHRGPSVAEGEGDDMLRWDQPSQEVLNATVAGGLPQSFWPFSGVDEAQNGDNHQNEGVISDDLNHRDSYIEQSIMHVDMLPYPTEQHGTVAQPVSHVHGIVKGIPVDHITGVCVGIPVGHISGSECSYMSYPYQLNNNNIGQGVPISMSATMPEECNVSEEEFRHVTEASEEIDVKFGISHAQFFQQMRCLFGSSFQPWQLQSIMASHAWGPYLSGDARIKLIGRESGPVSHGYDCSGTESGNVLGYDQELDPTVAGDPYSQNARRPYHQQYMPNRRGNNASYQNYYSGSWKNNRFNTSRSKFQGYRQRNHGFNRDPGFSRRNNWQTVSGVGPSHSNWNKEGHSFRQNLDRGWDYPSSHEMDTEEYMADQESFYVHDESMDDSGNPTASVALERPWLGYAKENHFRGNNDYY